MAATERERVTRVVGEAEPRCEVQIVGGARRARRENETAQRCEKSRRTSDGAHPQLLRKAARHAFTADAGAARSAPSCTMKLGTVDPCSR